MCNEYKFVIEMLSDFINGRKTEVDYEINWDTVAELCRAHNINGILYHQCSSFLDEKSELELCIRYGGEITVYNKRETLFNDIKSAFQQNGITFCTCKGFDIAKFYPVPALRTMGDCDIIIHPDDSEPAEKIMLELGFEKVTCDTAETVFFKNGLKFELHTHLIENDEYNEEKFAVFADKIWDYCIKDDESGIFKLDIGYHLIYLLLHIRKHLVFSGIGIRQFCDIAVTVRNNDIDWDFVYTKLDELGLSRFAGICFGFCSRCFDTDIFGNKKTLDDNEFEHLLETVMKFGTFGYGTDDCDYTYLFNETKAGNKKVFMLKKYVKLIFPSYSDMLYGGYGFIKNKKYLLPFAWVRRWFFVIFHREKIKNSVNNLNELEKRAESRYNKLADWGLNK